MGKVKIDIKRIENVSSRKTTWRKRSDGLRKKVHELAVLCGADTKIEMESEHGKVLTYDSRTDCALFNKVYYGDKAAKKKSKALHKVNAASRVLPPFGEWDLPTSTPIPAPPPPPPGGNLDDLVMFNVTPDSWNFDVHHQVKPHPSVQQYQQYQQYLSAQQQQHYYQQQQEASYLYEGYQQQGYGYAHPGVPGYPGFIQDGPQGGGVYNFSTRASEYDMNSNIYA